jgi:hypothetical protein
VYVERLTEGEEILKYLRWVSKYASNLKILIKVWSLCARSIEIWIDEQHHI